MSRSTSQFIQRLEQRCHLSATPTEITFALDGGTTVVNVGQQPANPVAPAGEFEWINQTGTAFNFDLGEFGIENQGILYPQEFMMSDWLTVDESRFRNAIRRMVDRGYDLTILDMEDWPLDIRKHTEAEVQFTMRWFGQMVDVVRDEAPGMRVGFYMLPNREYWAPVEMQYQMDAAPTDAWSRNALVNSTQKYIAWQQSNEFLRPLLDKVDVIAPSLYAFYDDLESWKIYARHNIMEASRFGKPVIPYLKWNFHDASIVADRYVGDTFWREKVELVRQMADGMVFWNGHLINEQVTDPWVQVALSVKAEYDGLPNGESSLSSVAMPVSTSGDQFRPVAPISNSIFSDRYVEDLLA